MILDQEITIVDYTSNIRLRGVTGDDFNTAEIKELYNKIRDRHKEIYSQLGENSDVE